VSLVRLPLALALTALALLGAGCTGDGGEDGADLAGRLRVAKQVLDRAASIDVELRADPMPPSVDGIRAAAGVATHDPAFRGRITIAAGGLLDGQTIEVVAVGGQVYAQTPFASSFVQVDPATFNAPDPATLLDRRRGLSTLLTSATDLQQRGQQREGEEVLTEVTGQVPGSTVARVFPSAARARPFAATFLLTEDDRLQQAEVRGPFYAGRPPVTYEITLAASDAQVEITAP
jgi:lipoprotein LprG